MTHLTHGRDGPQQPGLRPDTGRAGQGTGGAGTVLGMTDAEQTPEVEQRLAKDLDPERHRKPSEGAPQDLPDDDGEDAAST